MNKFHSHETFYQLRNLGEPFCSIVQFFTPVTLFLWQLNRHVSTNHILGPLSSFLWFQDSPFIVLLSNPFILQPGLFAWSLFQETVFFLFSSLILRKENLGVTVNCFLGDILMKRVKLHTKLNAESESTRPLISVNIDDSVKKALFNSDSPKGYFTVPITLVNKKI